MRKTKIVCTIGPASETEQIITGLCKAGMNVARLNFSHNTHEDHQRRIDLVKKVRSDLKMPIAIMLDTKGSEYRIKTFKNQKITLNDGDKFTFTTEDILGDETKVAVSYPNLPNELSVGDTILLNNGLLTFEVVNIDGANIECTVVIGGELSDRKSMSFPGKVMQQEYLSEQDKKDIAFGVQNDVDYIACSFVSKKQDLIDVHNYLKELNADDIELIAKIENQSGFDNIEEICEECDGIMIARGDMGVEIPYEEVPVLQKMIIKKVYNSGKPVITATQMLDSMIKNPRPTRAETTDVANAIYDGTSAIMLSGETASGKYPVEALKTMVRIAIRAEEDIDYKKRFYIRDEVQNPDITDAISRATVTTAHDLNAKMIVTVTTSGKTARMVSRYRPACPIVACTTDSMVCRQLNLAWGVKPLLIAVEHDTFELFDHAMEAVEKAGHITRGELAILTAGVPLGISGTTNILKVQIAGSKY